MKLFLGICNSQDFVPAGFFWSFINIKSQWQTEVYRSTHPWDIIRNNRIIDKFLKSDCDVLVKMDIDQAYPPMFFEKLVPLVEQYKVIGPMIKDRWRSNGFCPLAFSSHDGMVLHTYSLTGKSGVVEIPYAHTNLFYAREVLEKVPPPWYEATQTEDGLERKNHVDFTFLDKIKAAGYPIYIDLDTVVAHQYVGYAT